MSAIIPLLVNIVDDMAQSIRMDKAASTLGLAMAKRHDQLVAKAVYIGEFPEYGRTFRLPPDRPPAPASNRCSYCNNRLVLDNSGKCRSCGGGE